MISRVSLKNFKLHASTEIEPAPITVFIGPNNSGKSSVFQALLSLCQAASRERQISLKELSTGKRQGLLTRAERQAASVERTYLFPAGAVIDIGEFNDVVRHGESEIEIGISGEVRPKRFIKHGGPVEVGFEVRFRDNHIVSHRGYLDLQPARTTWLWGEEKKSSALEIGILILHFEPVRQFMLIERGKIEKRTVGPENAADFEELHRYLSGTPAQLLESLHPVFPLRGFEEWGYPLPDSASPGLDRLTLPDRAVALASVVSLTLLYIWRFYS